MSVDLSTTYLGLKLKNPLVISACPFSGEVDRLERLEQAGAAAAVLPSLFEEQIEHDAEELTKAQEFGTDSFAEALTYFPEWDEYRSGPEAYLEMIGNAKKKVAMPIIASLNGSSKGGWVRYAKMMQDAGADALELNVYFVATDLGMTGQGVEARYLDLVAAVKQSLSIPLAVKIGPYFSAMANFGKRLVEAGADGLVLFNRFYQPDINLEAMQAEPRLHLSSPYEVLVPIRWIAILYGHVNASLAATGGIHDATELRQGDPGRRRRRHDRLGALSEGHPTSRRDPGRPSEMDARERLRVGRTTQGQHEPRKLSRPCRLSTRQLHEGADLLHRQGNLTTRSSKIGGLYGILCQRPHRGGVSGQKGQAHLC